MRYVDNIGDKKFSLEHSPKIWAFKLHLWSLKLYIWANIWAFKPMKILDGNLIEQLCSQGLNNPRKMESKISEKALSNFKTQEK